MNDFANNCHDLGTLRHIFKGQATKETAHRFDEKENISGFQQLKTSVQKGIRSKILEQYPYIENCINDVLPKKEPFRLMKCHEHIEVLVGANDPYILPWQQVDKGAIRFVLSGANIMCPGLTSPGARMTPCPKGAIVAIMAEGKQHALAVGITSMSTADIQSVNKGIGVENYHYLNDGLWILKPMK
uniref:EOG090X0FDS n=1 Tax=Daphnia magna TaxID=35525 RepID=A0A4Y7MGI9_9CRUS|nr:EOG090X0FDS [Daphnia magna]